MSCSIESARHPSTRVLLGLGLAALTCHAAITPCAPAEAAADGGTGVLSGYSGSANGCAAVDMSFENVGISSATASGGYATSTMTSMAAWATGAAPVGNSIGPVTFALNAIDDDNWSSTDTNGSMDVTVDYLAVAHTGGAYSGGSYDQPLAPYFWIFDAVQLNPSVSIDDAHPNNHATITLTICLGSATTAGCAAEYLGTITASFTSVGSTGTFTCSETSSLLACAAGNTTLDLLAGAQFNTIAVTTRIQTRNQNKQGTVAVDWVETSFSQAAEVPEPGTCCLRRGDPAAKTALNRLRFPRPSISCSLRDPMRVTFGGKIIVTMLRWMLLLLALPLAAKTPEWDQAYALVRNSQYSQAVEILEKASKKDPDNLELLGEAYYGLENYKKATDVLEDAAKLAPKDSNVFLWLGRAWGRRAENNRFMGFSWARKAKDGFEKAVSLDPFNREALDDLFQFYLEAPGIVGGGLDKAEAVARKIKVLDHNWGEKLLAVVASERKK